MARRSLKEDPQAERKHWTMFGAGITRYKSSQIRAAAKKALVVRKSMPASKKITRTRAHPRKVSLNKALSVLADATKTNTQRINHTYKFASVSRETAKLFDVGMSYMTLDLGSAIFQATDRKGIFHYKHALQMILQAFRTASGIMPEMSDDLVCENVVCSWSLFAYLHDHALKKQTNVSSCTNCPTGIFVTERTTVPDQFDIRCCKCKARLLPPDNKTNKGSSTYRYPWKTNQLLDLFEQIDMLHGPSKSIVTIHQSPLKVINVETIFLVSQCREKVTDNDTGKNHDVLQTTPALRTFFIAPSHLLTSPKAHSLYAHFKHRSVSQNI